MRSSRILFCLSAALAAAASAQVSFVRVTPWPRNAKAVVTHTIDDASHFVQATLDAMDRHGIKSTVFLNTGKSETVEKLWPRLRAAVAAGHEIGAHSRKHQCKWPDDEDFCRKAFNDEEVIGVRSDILANTEQPYVWSWCYPCGNCAGYSFVQEKLKQAGYLVARNYPDEANDGHLVPDMNDFAKNAFNAAFTQSVQTKGGLAKNGNTDVAKLNAKFDQVLAAGGIYHFMSHPQWLDLAEEGFYEKHLAHVGHRADVWYVPFGHLYAYRETRDKTVVKPSGGGRFTVSHGLDPKVFSWPVTLEFKAPRARRVTVNGQPVEADRAGESLLVTVTAPATIEIR